MSKKNKTQPEPQAPEAEQPQPLQAAEPSRPPVSRAMIWTFWGGVAAAYIAARALDAALPSVPERVVERWIMLAFAAFLAFFLYKLR